ncbi:MAG: HD domain-containing protein [Oligoflexia bacterium]|nr:HD domain-containing protein [Oligoflexia bacterium]
MIENFVEFIKYADQLKQVKRKTFNYHEKVYENSGEHSWHLTLAVLTFSSLSNEKIDLLKCIKMALIHDLVEIDGGDQIIYAEDPDKFDRELKAAKKIFGMLPSELGDDLLETWIEFEKKESAEAKYVGSLDRFLPLYSNVLNEGHSWKTHNISKAMILDKNENAISSGSTEIWNFAKKCLNECEEKGLLKN